MSNLKDSDIDDLLRRASDKYPLRTDSADWDRMAAALEKDPPPPGNGTDPDDKRKRRRFFWLFLLLLLGGLGYYAWHGTGTGHQAVATDTKPAASGDSATHAGSSTTAASRGNTIAASTTTASTAATTTAASTSAPAATRSGTAASAGSAGETDEPDHTPATTLTRSTASPRTTSRPDRLATKRSTHPGSDNNRFGDDNTAITTPDNTLSLKATNNTLTGGDRLFFDLQRAPINTDYHLLVNVTAPTKAKDSSHAKQKTPKGSHFYAGLLAAPDLSMVKMQSVKGVGTTYGILLGYAFNKHWSIETGAYLDMKKYYTDGEYFNTKGLNLPANEQVLNVNGSCNMWEIPLNIRYNFNPQGRLRWFATAGFSTYLMTGEKYTYVYKSIGGNTTWPNSWDIKKPSQYPFSIINLSAGFEQRLGKVGSLRIEPYVRVPLTGMGTGKLPIMSTGINIGITRQLWK